MKVLMIAGFLVLSSLFILFFSGAFGEVRPQGRDAVFDLFSWNGKNVLLNGIWEFYWSAFITPGSLPDEGGKLLVSVPSSWTGYTWEGKTLPSRGYGSYRLVLKNADDMKQYGLRITSFATSYRLFVNGKEIASNGNPGIDGQSTVPLFRERTVAFDADKGTAEIVVHVANFYHQLAGFWEPVQFGYYDEIAAATSRNYILDILISGILLYIIVSYFFLYITNRSMPEYIYFVLMNVFLLIRILLSGEQLLCDFIPLFYSNFGLFRKVFSISTMLGIIFFTLMFSHLYRLKNRYLNIPIVSTMSALCVLIAVFPIYEAYVFVMLNNIPTSALLIGMIVVCVRGVIRKTQFSLLYLLGSLFLLLTVLHDMLFSLVLLPSTTYMSQYGLVFYIFCQAFIFALKHQLTYRRNEKLAGELKVTNRELEKKITWKNKANRLLRRMSKKLLSKDNREQKKISKDLHDTIGQYLAVSSMHVKSLDLSLDTGEFREKREIVTELLDDSIASVRNLSFLLYPPYIDEIEFIELTGRLCRVFEGKYRVPVKLDTRIDRLKLPRQTQRILFRSIRELLMNFIKHGTSGNIRISIVLNDHRLDIDVSSDELLARTDEISGKIDRKKSFGLFILRENLALIGARLALDGEKGAFCIKLKLREE